MSRRTHLVRSLLVVMLLPITSGAQRLNARSLKDILASQGFSGVLHGKIAFAFLGNMKCNPAEIQVYDYTWEETNPPGRAVHFSQRLIFIHDQKYLGQYVIEDRPTLTRSGLLRFPYSKELGNTIQCKRGGLPESVYVDGYNLALQR